MGCAVYVVGSVSTTSTNSQFARVFRFYVVLIFSSGVRIKENLWPKGRLRKFEHIDKQFKVILKL